MAFLFHWNDINEFASYLSSDIARVFARFECQIIFADKRSRFYETNNNKIDLNLINLF